MIVVPWQDFVAGKSGIRGPVNLTVGVFDGVHLGHRRLIRALTEGPARSLVVTFRQNPEVVLGGGDAPAPILTLAQKLERLESLGVDWVVAIDFSEQFSRLSGKAFVGLLKENLSIGKIAVGYDSRFGRDRDTDARTLRTLAGTNTSVEVVEPVYDGEEVISSSRIRTSIRDAGFGDAGRMLGAPHSLDLTDVPQTEESPAQSARVIRMRTQDIRQCLPKPGSYPVSSEAETAAAGLLLVGDEHVELELPRTSGAPRRRGGGKITHITFQQETERSPHYASDQRNETGNRQDVRSL